MKPVEEMEYFAPQEELVKMLVQKTQNDNPLFFRILVAYNLTKMASMMRAKIDAPGIGVVPVNFYGINLSPSGSGKGFSTNIIESKVVNQFKKRFITETFPAIARNNLQTLSASYGAQLGLSSSEAFEKLEKMFDDMGTYPYGFDSGTLPAVKQLRSMLLMAQCGAINFEVDEIGSNLVNNGEVLNIFLELFDVGGTTVKQKLTKNTQENQRGLELDGITPANMMLYGTPSKLLNGGSTENEFYSMQDTGYARRCFLGYARHVHKPTSMTAEQLYDMLNDHSTDAYVDKLSDDFYQLASQANFDLTIDIDKPMMIKLLQYKLDCERAATEFKDHEELLKAEMSHRYYKVLKLAGAYAFIECNKSITEENLESAIKLAEECGESFKKLLTRPKIPERIARYLADQRKEVTQVDMMEDLPFYRGSVSQRKDIMTQAIAWGYRNDIVIRTSYADNIEFFKGESMETTDLQNMKVSYSNDITVNYQHETAEFEELHKLICADGFHYASHEFEDGYRDSEHAVPGFNLLMLDVDDGTPLKAARMLLKDYKALFATTKRHTEEHNRYRIIMPLSHVVKLSPETHRQFMENVFSWLPFDTDAQTKDIARKWQSHDGEYYYQDGQLLDALMFIPDTRKQQEQQTKILDNAALSNLERWFLLNASVGSRSNTLIKYVYVLVDSGHSFESIKQAVGSFNSRLKNPLPPDELERTVLVTAMRQIHKRDNPKK